MIAILKAFHIAALAIWCAGLITLPVLLGLHRHILRDKSAHSIQYNYTRFRKLTHLTYTAVATPAAVLAIGFGTALIFAAGVFEMWLLAKLACVVGMVLAHIWLGHLIVQSSEKEVDWPMPNPVLAFFVALPSMAGVLWFVLAKPDLQSFAQALPAWLQTPLDINWNSIAAHFNLSQRELP